MTEPLQQAKDLVDQATKIAVLTGAGISTDSGIPDFRGPNGIWTKNPEAEKASNIHYYRTDPEIRKRNWALRVSGELWPNITPNDGHRALAHLEKRGLLHMLVTQNVDGLHQMAGNDPDRVVEIHGTVKEAMCLECDWRDDIEIVLQRVREGDVDPHCSCGGLLKSATVSFGQNLFPGDIDKMFEASLACDLLLAVGTSLQVFPVAEMLPTAVNNGAKAVIVNGESTAMDQLAEVVVKGEISKVLPEIVAL
ncbi:MAG: NAD-dependent deacetylase [Acidimicrobiaceae bacterium]|nr:NAD-dependent deacetylase [Acidimicrobiaceae bacterium]